MASPDSFGSSLSRGVLPPMTVGPMLRYDLVLQSVKDTLCRLGLPGGGDASSARTIEALSAFHGSGKVFYAAYAKSYVNGVAVPAIILHQRKRAIVAGEWGIGLDNAELSGLMLSMYLDQRVDKEIIDRVRRTTLSSDNFEWLVNFIEEQVQMQLGSFTGRPAESAIRNAAQAACDTARKSDDRGGKNFKFSKEGLKPIIEGIGGLDVFNASLEAPGFGDMGDTAAYRLIISVRDTYKFINERRVANAVSGNLEETQYTRYRTKLADLLRAERYAEFELTYAQAMCDAPLGGGTDNNIDKTMVFASYMYALEAAGFFKGLPWSMDLKTRRMTLIRPLANPDGPKGWPGYGPGRQ